MKQLQGRVFYPAPLENSPFRRKGSELGVRQALLTFSAVIPCCRTWSTGPAQRAPFACFLFKSRKVNKFLPDHTKIMRQLVDIFAVCVISPTVCRLVADILQSGQCLFCVPSKVPA